MEICACDGMPLYLQIGMLFAGFVLAWYLLICLIAVFNYCISYINETPYKAPPRVLVKVLDRLSPPSFNHFIDFVSLFFATLVGMAIVLFAWLPILVILFAHGVLRTLRFMMRIKKGIVNLIHNKKCLKDYTENDSPKMEF